MHVTLHFILYATQPRFEVFVTDSVARCSEERQCLVHIVVIQQHLGQDLPAQVQMVDVGAAVVSTGVTGAAGNLMANKKREIIERK